VRFIVPYFDLASNFLLLSAKVQLKKCSCCSAAFLRYNCVIFLLILILGSDCLHFLLVPASLPDSHKSRLHLTRFWIKNGWKTTMVIKWKFKGGIRIVGSKVRKQQKKKQSAVSGSHLKEFDLHASYSFQYSFYF
jgi:hypothetical protein